MKKILPVLASAFFLIGTGAAITSCKSGAGRGHEQGAAEKKLYHCPMHPSYTSDKPGDCPICGMKLVPIESEETRSGAEGPSGHEGHSPLQISPEREQLIGVKTGRVEVRELTKAVRASARVAYDAELYNSLFEHKAALSAKEKIKESPWPDVHERADALVRASELRLRQLGMSEDQMRNLNRDYPDPTNLLLGDKSGSVWIYAQIYEFESGYVRPGQTMRVTSPALPGRSFTGLVRAVDPILNSETRSLRVRADVPNPEGWLKPEMYVNAEITIPLGRKLAVPEDAVLNTGERQIVFLAAGGGKYEPRNVQLGAEAEGYYEVLSGLSEGETVVTSANFLIDSESRLKAAISGSAGSAGSGGHSH